MIKRETVYKIGRIGKPHGIDGEVSLHFDDDIFDRTDADYLILDIDGILVPFFIDEYRFKTDETALMRFTDIDTQERARSLTGCDVYFPREHSDNGNGCLSWAAIVGFHVVDSVSGKPIGEITRVDDSTINTLFDLRIPDGNDILIPASDELITAIDAEGRTVTMQLPDGLLDI
jgi:16S rRNA processing protein RimM